MKPINLIFLLLICFGCVSETSVQDPVELGHKNESLEPMNPDSLGYFLKGMPAGKFAYEEGRQTGIKRKEKVWSSKTKFMEDLELMEMFELGDDYYKYLQREYKFNELKELVRHQSKYVRGYANLCNGKIHLR